MGAPGTTDGPWVADEYGTFNGPDGSTVAVNGFAIVCSAGERQQVARRNGIQAAASPALYDACEALDRYWLEAFAPPGDPDEARILAPETLAVWRQIRAALALARGESQ